MCDTYSLSFCVLLPTRPPHSIETLSAAAEKATGIPAHLPNSLLLKDTIRKAREWLQEAEELQVRTHWTFHDLFSMWVDLSLIFNSEITCFFSGQWLHTDDGQPL